MNIGQTELIGLSLLQSNISFPSAGIRDMSEERWTVIRQRGLWSSMTTLHIYMIHILQQSHFLLGLNWH